MKYSTSLMAMDEGYFELQVLLDIVGGSSEIALPSNFSGRQSFLKTGLLERVVNGKTIPLSYRKRFMPSDVNITDGTATNENYLPTYDFRGNNLVIEPTPDTSETGGLLMHYSALPPRLRAGNPQASGATSITLDLGADPRDDYYNSQRIYIVSGDGAGDIRTITDYVGSTKVATIDSAWSTNPAVTSVWSILIHEDFPENFHDLLPLYATKCAYLKERARGAQVTFDDSRLNELQQEFMEYTEKRTDSPRFVRPWNIEIE